MNRKLGWSICLSVLIFSLRLNDFPAILIPIGIYLERAPELKTPKFRWMLSFISAVIFGVISYFVLQGYHSTQWSGWVHRFQWLHFKEVFFGGDWGLLFTALPWLIVLAVGLRRFQSLSRVAQAALFWMLAELIICLGWKGNGSDFGYRYLIGSYAAFYLVLQEWILPYGVSRFGRSLKSLIVGESVFVFVLLYFYKMFSDTTPRSLEGTTWTEPNLILNTLQHVFRPGDWILAFNRSAFSVLRVTLSNPFHPLALEAGASGPARTAFMFLVWWSAGALVMGIFYRVKRS